MPPIQAPSPDQKHEARRHAARLVKAEVRRLGEGGMEQVAARLYVHVSSVQQWVAGLRLPAFPKVDRIVSAYGRRS